MKHVVQRIARATAPFTAMHPGAPAPLSACGDNAPTAKKRLATATPKAADTSRAMSDQVTPAA